MRKTEKSIEPSMEEILASIRKIIAEEPPPAGHVAKDGEALPQGGQPGGPVAPPGSDLSDLFDEPARGSSDRPQAPKGPQAPQPDRRFSGPGPFGPAPARNQNQPSGAPQHSVLPGGNFLSAAPAEQNQPAQAPLDHPEKGAVSEAGPAKPVGGPSPGGAPAAGHDLQLATRLKDLSTTGPVREVDRSGQGPNPFTNTQAPAGPGMPPQGAAEAAKAEPDRAGARQQQDPPEPVASGARDGTGPADEGLPISVSIEQALSGSRDAAEAKPEEVAAPAEEQSQNGVSKFSQGVANSLAAIATPANSGTPAPTPAPTPLRPVPNAVADPASPQPTAPASHVVGPPAAAEEATVGKPKVSETVEVKEAVEPSPATAADDADQTVAKEAALEEALTTLLRPVVHEWLNENMPALVEKAVAERQTEQK
ncbi:MAG: DUF2497 domain-containing protein [Hyphomicrobiaceae bacterium]